MLRRICIVGAIALAVPVVAPARDRNNTAESPAAIKTLTACRDLPDKVARLSCYDAAVTTLTTAIATNDLYIVDQASVRKARSSLFGLRLPSLGFMSGDNDDKNAITQKDGIIASAVQETYGAWRVTLQDGSGWAQTDDAPLGLAPKPNDPVVIKRGVLASYKMSIKSRPAFRVKRIF